MSNCTLIGKGSGPNKWDYRCTVCDSVETVNRPYPVPSKPCKACAYRRRFILDPAVKVNDLPEYHIWAGICSRCINPRSQGYAAYGGKGLTVDPAWRGRGGFLRFMEHIGPRLSPLHSVDRKDNSKGYMRGNVRWATTAEQAANKRSTHKFTFDGVTRTLTQWCNHFGIVHAALVRTRLAKGNDPYWAFTTPCRESSKHKCPEKGVLDSARQRCHNPKNANYASYGGRGIIVAPEWHGPGGVQRFIEHIKPRPTSKHTLDRIDNNGSYVPGNVRWATSTEQNENRRNARNLTYQGRTQSIAGWARELGMSKTKILYRLNSGYTVEEALEQPGRSRPRPRKVRVESAP